MFKDFKKGFLLDKNKAKDKSPESSKKPGQLSTGDQQLALMGVSPKEYRERQSGQPESSRALAKQEGTLSSQENVHVHHTMEHVPSEALATFRELNKEIAENNAKFETVHSKHLENSKREILQTATIALERVPEGQPKKALLLGVGNGLDTPLRELAEKFDQLTLVELDKESTEGAIKQLPPELQKKCRLVVADVTGIAGELCKEIKEKVNTSNLSKKLLDTLAEKTNEAEKKVTRSTPDLGTDFAFASSQLVLSQLGSIPDKYIRNTVKDKFGVDLSSQPGGPDHDLFMSYQRLNSSLQKEHIRYLAKSVIPQGTVHLADTYARQILNSPSKPVLPMLIPNTIDPVIQASFKPIKEQTKWFFEHTPNQQQFLVMSHSLERNAN